MTGERWNVPLFFLSDLAVCCDEIAMNMRIHCDQYFEVDFFMIMACFSCCSLLELNNDPFSSHINQHIGLLRSPILHGRTHESAASGVRYCMGGRQPSVFILVVKAALNNATTASCYG